MARYIVPPPFSPFLKKLEKSVIEERRAKHGIFQNDPTSSYRIIHWNGGIEAISNCVIILVAWTILLFISQTRKRTALFMVAMVESSGSVKTRHSIPKQIPGARDKKGKKEVIGSQSCGLPPTFHSVALISAVIRERRIFERAD